MAQPNIVIYSTSWCGFCARARKLLKSKGASFQDIDIEESAASREEMERRSGRTSVPQIFIGERHVGGCDDLYALDAAGGLDPLLKGQS